jgi:glyoxylase-like metal-dependent hydrolase (beta-lactamase superfamily II)
VAAGRLVAARVPALDRASVTDPGYFPGGLTGVLYDRLARFEISPAETLTAGLDRLGYAAGDVKTAVISHLHQDHIGGLAELDHADIVVSQAEWDTLSSPLPQLRGLMRRHIDLPGLRWHRIEPEPLVTGQQMLVMPARSRSRVGLRSRSQPGRCRRSPISGITGHITKKTPVPASSRHPGERLGLCDSRGI